MNITSSGYEGNILFEVVFTLAKRWGKTAMWVIIFLG